MLFTALLVGILAGLAVGGRIDNLAAVRLRWPLLIFGAVVIRMGTEAALGRFADMDALRVPLLGTTYALLGAGLWRNRHLPGIGLALVGITCNAAAILLNGGYMPVWQPSLVAAGFGSSPDVLSALHVLLPPNLDLAFLAAAGPLGDIVPVPFPLVRNVLSIGDMILAGGLSLFVFTSLQRPPDEAQERGGFLARRRALPPVSHAGSASRIGRPTPSVGTPVADGGPLVLESALAAPAAAGTPFGAPGPGPAVAVRPGAIARARTHPYVRIVANGSFMSLWTGQLVSLFGDRLHQIALVFLVGGATGSAAFAVSLVFVMSTIPNLLFGAPVGVLVDRWDHKRVMVASDLIRAVLVLLIPVAVSINLVLVYPLVFAIATTTIFFRPARSAAVPRIVADDELVTANSATWLSETLADIVGYPLAGLFVAFLAQSLPLAFWLDAATYLVSAALILMTRIGPPRRREDDEPAEEPGGGFRADLVAGLRFLRHEPVLWANTVQAVVAQFTIGATIALSPIYAGRVLATPGAVAAADGPAIYAFMETMIGVGSLIGGLILGILGNRIRRGRMVIGGYLAYGLAVVAMGLTGNTVAALGLCFGMGVANMVFVIPTQTLFQERTPDRLMGRVLSFRFSVVFGSMTLAMAISGLLGEVLGVQAVFVIFGAVTAIAGLAGLGSRALRHA